MERPILMSAPMVRATLRDADPKTQTRRAFSERMLKLMRGAIAAGEVSDFLDSGAIDARDLAYVLQFCPYGKSGDHLWVRETFAPCIGGAEGPENPTLFRADAIDGYDKLHWRPSIHMPRWASRITLEIVSVRVERVQDISESDAIAEGIDGRRALDEPSVMVWRDYGGVDAFLGQNDPRTRGPVASYRTLWESIHGDGSWAANPWVFAIEFRRVEQ